MSVRPLPDFLTPWSAADGATVATGRPGPHADAPFAAEIDFPGGSPAGRAFLALPAPLDLSAFSELRFWLKMPAGVSPGFPLRFGFADAGDPPGIRRQYRLPVARADWWEQVRVGIAEETRGAVTQLDLQPDTDAPVKATLGELLAVRPEMFSDVEATIVARAGDLDLPGLSRLPLVLPAAAGDGQVVIGEVGGIVPGTRIEIDDGAGSRWRFDVAVVSVAGGQITLGFGGSANLPASLAAGTSTVTVRVEVGADPAAAHAVNLTLLDAREDRQRTQYLTLRDSFRVEDGGISAAERPYPQAWLLDYQLTVAAPLRAHLLGILDQLAARFTFDRPLRVGGVLTPLSIFWRPDLPRGRDPELPAALHMRVSAQQEAGPRRQARLSENLDLGAAPDGAVTETIRIGS